MIQLEVLEKIDAIDHVSVRADEAMRIEIINDDGHLVVHVYRGDADNEDDEPVGGYDSANDENKSWEDYA
jgi:hypothetical protein